MEEPNSTDSLVLAATNQVEILDRALARRFNEVIEYTLPAPEHAHAIVESRLGEFKIPAKAWNVLEPEIAGLSPGELVRAADVVVRGAILDGSTVVSVENLRAALHNRQTLKDKFHVR
jgi:AAA+ superfamily predicted ATPase